MPQRQNKIVLLCLHLAGQPLSVSTLLLIDFLNYLYKFMKYAAVKRVVIQEIVNIDPEKTRRMGKFFFSVG